MNRQQHILHSVFRVRGMFEASPGDRPDIGLNLQQQRAVLLAVAALRQRHPFRPIDLLAGSEQIVRLHQRQMWARLTILRHSRTIRLPAFDRYHDIRRRVQSSGYTRKPGCGSKQFFVAPLTFLRIASNLSRVAALRA